MVRNIIIKVLMCTDTPRAWAIMTFPSIEDYSSMMYNSNSSSVS